MKISKAQVSIEITISLIALFIFLVGITKVWVWSIKCLVERQQAYEQSRMDMSIDYYTPAALRIFD